MASGVVFGADPDAAPLPNDVTLTALEALERAMLPALESERCFVSFSGGRDSSAILACATRLAKREGLRPPTPTILTYEGIPEMDESSWQKRVLDHLEIHDVHRIPVNVPEMDLLGPLGCRYLERYGLLWPGLYHSLDPQVQALGGAVILTGIDGDALFGAWVGARLVTVSKRAARPEARDLLRAVYASSPLRLKLAVKRRQKTGPRFPWLQERAQREVAEANARQAAEQPIRWDRWVRWLSRRRYLMLERRSIQLVGDQNETMFVHPFLDPTFLAALARQGGATGWGGRTTTMRALFGELLPDDVLARKDKADMTRLYLGPETQHLASEWRGGGVDTELVNEQALRRTWARGLEDVQTISLLQQVWLHRRAASINS
jgi:asparagine synthase (glutamine-hydrolysing)